MRESMVSAGMFALVWSLLVAVAWGRGSGGDPIDRGQALRALYDLCSGRVMAVALKLLGDRAEAEDVVQETFLELWRRAADYDPSRASPATWAVMVGRSRAQGQAAVAQIRRLIDRPVGRDLDGVAVDAGIDAGL